MIHGPSLSVHWTIQTHYETSFHGTEVEAHTHRLAFPSAKMTSERRHLTSPSQLTDVRQYIMYLFIGKP